MPHATITIPSRFHGPPNSGNGGYVCGIIARQLNTPCAVRLKAPPPLETELQLAGDQYSARLLDGEAVIGQGSTTELDLEVPEPPSLEQARAAASHFLGFSYHPFPACFVCGPQRQPGDGLCLFPGPVAGTDMIATPWHPDPGLADDDGNVRTEFLWAALDCPGAFVQMPRPEGTGIVLGELAAEVQARAPAGHTYIVCAWPLGRDGKKLYSGTAIFSETGELIARARAIWIDIPLASWQ